MIKSNTYKCFKFKEITINMKNKMSKYPLSSLLKNYRIIFLIKIK
ncbi:hypothetical protein XBI1_400017 [Xenorhabdus bovienii str. Intermedium]|uniref:Uncharacterized protein n=1 Tax=Xenorhabdus bovienii str. Intermedium TaxID=1379677 RepID=A0A077QF09_XENBV|nr:hypothetical protein XBI1_400017 [Xenorhabdus bovienii str. Intermedium]